MRSMVEGRSREASTFNDLQQRLTFDHFQ